MKNVKKNIRIILIASFSFFLMMSFITNFRPGKDIAQNFYSFSLHMLKILPCVFILLGLFEVWVKSEVIERHLGESAGWKGYIWAVLFAGTIVGGLYVSFPIAYALYKKGAKLGVIFAFIGASAICRVPMAIFETSFLGIKFTIIRILISIPLVIITSELLGRYLKKKDYKMLKGDIS